MFYRMIKKADIREAIIERLHWVSSSQFTSDRLGGSFRPEAVSFKTQVSDIHQGDECKVRY